MGVRPFFNDEAHEYLDNARGLSDADRRDSVRSEPADEEHVGHHEHGFHHHLEHHRHCEEDDGTADGDFRVVLV